MGDPVEPPIVRARVAEDERVQASGRGRFGARAPPGDHVVGVHHHPRDHAGRVGFDEAQVAPQHLAQVRHLGGGAERFGAGEFVDAVEVAVLGEAGRGDRCDVRRVAGSGPAGGERR